MTRKEALNDFFNTALKGESKTYNDHNWYNSGGLRGYIEGRNAARYPLLTKPLSQYTIGEVKAFQARSRDANGQLYATGRYQIIPKTLSGVVSKVGLKNSDLYNEENQDKLAVELLTERSAIKNYLNGTVADTLENRQKASLEMSKIWASIGVPYATNGVGVNQSYYDKNGVDKAHVTSEDVMQKLKDYRNNIKNLLAGGVEFVKKKPLITISLAIVTVVAIYTIYNSVIRKK
jgi:hypothetical protein